MAIFLLFLYEYTSVFVGIYIPEKSNRDQEKVKLSNNVGQI